MNNNDFFKDLNDSEELDSKKVKKKPIYIELAGNLGSGVSTCARGLSKNLDAYLFSTDYYRNMLYLIRNGAKDSDFTNAKAQALYRFLSYKYSDITKINEKDVSAYIENAVKEESKRVIKRLIKDRESIVVDRHLKDKDLKFKLAPLGYKNIRVYVNSADRLINKKRVSLKNLNYNESYEGVNGMNLNYSGSYDNFDDLYLDNSISNKHISSPYFDYIIDNNESTDTRDKDIKKISYCIKYRR